MVSASSWSHPEVILKSPWSHLEVCLKIWARNKKNEHFGTDRQTKWLPGLLSRSQKTSKGCLISFSLYTTTSWNICKLQFYSQIPMYEIGRLDSIPLTVTTSQVTTHKIVMTYWMKQKHSSLKISGWVSICPSEMEICLSIIWVTSCYQSLESGNVRRYSDDDDTRGPCLCPVIRSDQGGGIRSHHVTSFSLSPPRLTLAVGWLHQSPVIMARQSLRCAEIGWAGAGLICIKLLQVTTIIIRSQTRENMQHDAKTHGQWAAELLSDFRDH